MFEVRNPDFKKDKGGNQVALPTKGPRGPVETLAGMTRRSKLEKRRGKRKKESSIKKPRERNTVGRKKGHPTKGNGGGTVGRGSPRPSTDSLDAEGTKEGRNPMKIVFVDASPLRPGSSPRRPETRTISKVTLKRKRVIVQEWSPQKREFLCDESVSFRGRCRGTPRGGSWVNAEVLSREVRSSSKGAVGTPKEKKGKNCLAWVTIPR